ATPSFCAAVSTSVRRVFFSPPEGRCGVPRAVVYHPTPRGGAPPPHPHPPGGRHTPRAPAPPPAAPPRLLPPPPPPHPRPRPRRHVVQHQRERLAQRPREAHFQRRARRQPAAERHRGFDRGVEPAHDVPARAQRRHHALHVVEPAAPLALVPDDEGLGGLLGK